MARNIEAIRKQGEDMLPEWVTDELIEAAAKASFENWGGIAAPHQKEGGERDESADGVERSDEFLSAGPGTGADARRALPTWERQFKVDKLAWMSDMRAGLEVVFGRMRQLQVQGELRTVEAAGEAAGRIREGEEARPDSDSVG